MGDVTEIFENMHVQKRLNLSKAFGNADCLGVLDGSEIEIVKGLQSDDALVVEDAKEEWDEIDGVRKGEICDIVAYSEQFKVQKTGKEIKNQIDTVLLPAKNTEIQSLTDKLLDELENCGDKPTANYCGYWGNLMGIKTDYKYYNWNETCMPANPESSVCASLSYEHQENAPKLNCPKTEDEAKARMCYNDILCKIVDNMADVRACEILKDTLSDDKKISLSLRQLFAFKFI